jgi:general secretion pathway protein C
MTQIRVVPNFRNGSAEGWKVFAIRPNSIFGKVGLKNGDIVQSVNGRDISSMEVALEVFQDLRDVRNLDLQIVRRNVQRTLNYEIR